MRFGLEFPQQRLEDARLVKRKQQDEEGSMSI